MAKILTQAMLNKAKYFGDGKVLPKCVNSGCDNDVDVRDWKNYSFRHHCSNCINRHKKKLPPPPGVTFHKKSFCENRDGRLGFICPVDPDFDFPNSVLHGDHIDGNHENNVPDNLQTLCPICHNLKGMKKGDFISAKKGRKLS